MKHVTIINQTNPAANPVKARYCSSFLCRLKGLMFQKVIGKHDGLLMIQSRADRVESSIHMLFMAFDLAVIWIDDQSRVVDTQICHRWRPAYIPAAPARFVLETHIERISEFHIGDQLSFQTCD